MSLLLVGIQAIAQQTGSKPFVNSTHTYKVIAEGGGTLSWSVLDSSGNALTDPTSVFEFKGGETTSAVEILWKKKGDYRIRLTETKDCVTAREFNVKVVDNDFNVSIADLAADCSAASGTVILDDDSNLGTSERIFTISASDIPVGSKWEFNVAATVFGVANTNLSIDTGDATIAGGLVSVNSGTEVKVKVTFNNTFTGGDVVLTVSNGKELKFNTPDGKATDNVGSARVKSMPHTTKITTD